MVHMPDLTYGIVCTVRHVTYNARFNHVVFLWYSFYTNFHPSVATKIFVPELSHIVSRTFTASSMI